MASKEILVSWLSFNHDPYAREKNGSYIQVAGAPILGPTLEILFNQKSPLSGRIEQFYLLARRPTLPEDDQRPVYGREVDVASELLKAIESRSPGFPVKVVWWDTTKPPTDHRELFIFIAQTLAHVRRTHPKSMVNINLSPGTPAVHIAFMLAMQARIAGDAVRAFQGIPIGRRSEAGEVVQQVPWNLLAELEALYEGRPETAIEAPWSLEKATSPRLREVNAQISCLGSVPFPVLIMGARGTGKTSVARRLRNAYREWQLQATGTWNFHLNCAAFQDNTGLLRGELFGYMKGAYTGAATDHVGLLEEASDDCVFLDEIHWLPREAQGQLLLALQRGGTFRRVGGNRDLPAKFRLLAASNLRLPDLRENLTADFFDRVADFILELPELHHCHEDLAGIWDSVVLNACQELQEREPTRSLASAAAMAAEFQPHRKRILDTLLKMRLPGNFRDLEKLARRILVAGLANGRHLFVTEAIIRHELNRLKQDELRDQNPASNSGRDLLTELPTQARCEAFLREVWGSGGAFPLNTALSTWEQRLMLAAMGIAGSGAKAAGLLAINPRTFTNRIRESGKGQQS